MDNLQPISAQATIFSWIDSQPDTNYRLVSRPSRQPYAPPHQSRRWTTQSGLPGPSDASRWPLVWPWLAREKRALPRSGGWPLDELLRPSSPFRFLPARPACCEFRSFRSPLGGPSPLSLCSRRSFETPLRSHLVTLSPWSRQFFGNGLALTLDPPAALRWPLICVSS